jgi:hypothetical protein
MHGQPEASLHTIISGVMAHYQWRYDISSVALSHISGVIIHIINGVITSSVALPHIISGVITHVNSGFITLTQWCYYTHYQ